MANGLTHHLHLVSDATGETISSVARACLAQFEDADPVEHNWTLIRTGRQMERVLAGIKENPGLVLYTLAIARIGTVLRRSPVRRALEGMAGAALVGLGLRLAAENR